MSITTVGIVIKERLVRLVPPVSLGPVRPAQLMLLAPRELEDPAPPVQAPQAQRAAAVARVPWRASGC